MLRLYRLEMQKHLPHISFWVMMSLYTLLTPLFIWRMTTLGGRGSRLLDTFFQFPDIWETSVYFGSFFNFFLGFIVIGRITNEFSYRTVRQQIMDGMSRFEAIGTKVLFIVTLAIWATILLFGTTLVLGFLRTPEMAEVQIWDKSINILYFFLHALGYMFLAMLVSFLVKRSALAYLLFFFTWIGELILTTRFAELANWLPYHAFDNLIFKIYQDFTDFAGIELSTNFNWWLPVMYVVIFILGAYFLFRRSDL